MVILMKKKFKVGIIGATGMVGQRFLTLLENHPWFETVLLAASGRSAGKTYQEAVAGRWKLDVPVPEKAAGLILYDASDVKTISGLVDFVFCAVDMGKDEIKKLEENYARAETPVISNNSVHRWTPDVPMLVPEINSGHTAVISAQKKRLGTTNGFIVVKPNCSIQSYMPPLNALMDFEPEKASICTYQAISGGGKIFTDWPEILDNVIPFISGEEEKSEKEPLKIWGKVNGDVIESVQLPIISAQCYRVPVADGHMAAVSVSFKNKPDMETMINRWNTFASVPQELNLPSAPKQFIKYFDESDRPQSKLDRNYENGMGVTVGRLREDCLFQYKFACLSHNTIRGAAGGGILSAELLVVQGILNKK